MKIGLIILDPPDDHVRIDHASIGRQSKPHPSTRAHVDGKRDRLLFLVKLPVQGVHVSPFLVEHRLKAVLLHQVLVGVGKAPREKKSDEKDTDDSKLHLGVPKAVAIMLRCLEVDVFGALSELIWLMELSI